MAGIKRYFAVDNKKQLQAKQKAREAKIDDLRARAAALFNSSKYQSLVLVTLTKTGFKAGVDKFLGDRAQVEKDYYDYYDHKICWNADDMLAPCIVCKRGGDCGFEMELNEFELEITDDKADLGLFLLQLKGEEPATTSWLLKRFKDETDKPEQDDSDTEMT